MKIKFNFNKVMEIVSWNLHIIYTDYLYPIIQGLPFYPFLLSFPVLVYEAVLRLQSATTQKISLLSQQLQSGGDGMGTQKAKGKTLLPNLFGYKTYKCCYATCKSAQVGEYCCTAWILDPGGLLSQFALPEVPHLCSIREHRVLLLRLLGILTGNTRIRISH